MTPARWALVTGGARGLGHACVGGLLDAGCDVVLADRDRCAGEASRADWAGRYPQRRVEFVPLDLAVVDDIVRLAEGLRRDFAALHILINNAGLFPPFQRAQTDAGCELGFGVDGPTPIYCDNTAAKAVAENPVASRQLRHVARRHFFVQDAVQAGCVTVPYVASDANLADSLTKILPTAPRFEWAVSRLRSWVMAA